MRIALIRGSLLRTWELPNYVIDGAEVTAFASPRAAAALGAAPIPVRTLRSLGDLRGSLSPRVGGALELVSGSLEYLPGLERALDGFDIAHPLELPNPCTLQAVRARERGHCKRVIATVMENIPFRPAANRFVAKRIAETAREVDHFQAITQRARLHLRTAGVPDERITTLPLGVDMERFAPAEDARRDGPVRVLTVSRLEPAKGVEDLVIAAGLLAERGVEIELTLMGNGPLHDRLEWIAGELGIADRVHLPGGVPWERLHEVYRAHDVFVLASAPTRTWREQFGFALIEAMGCGLPVLVGDSGSLMEVAGAQERLVRPHDPPALADKLEALVSDAALRRREGEASRARALEHYDQRLIRRRLGELYARVLAG